MPTWITDAFREFPILLMLLGVGWLLVKFTREIHDRTVADMRGDHANHLRSKEEEIGRLVALNEQYRQMLTKQMADDAKERERLYKRLFDRRRGAE
jgi:hypothetical protein